MPKNILVVDDDPAQRRLLESLVTSQGYRASVASNGAAALEALRAPGGSEIDLVLMDLVMPGMNGMEVLGELRPERPALPVIVLRHMAAYQRLLTLCGPVRMTSS